MSSFDELRRSLVQTRDARQKSARALFLVRQQLAQTETALEDLDRRANDRQGGDQRRALLEKKARLEATQRERQRALTDVSDKLADLSGVFHQDWTDPREHLGQLTPNTPVLLFPLRLETRFKTVGRGVQQLWVRVYPDDCLVDTFEDTLASGELDSAAIFWREYFHAAGDEGLERAAWRGLVASHGSGRASWIVKHLRPLNPLAAGDPDGDATLPPKPSAKAAGDVLLVVSVEDGATTSSERAALGIYWAAFWKAAGASTAESAAFSILSLAVGAARATQIATQVRPYNLIEAPPATFTRTTATPRVVVVVLPKRDDIDTKNRSWTKAARVDLLPERFVLLGYRGGVQVLNAISQPVASPLSVSPDPTADPATQFVFDADGNLTLGDDLRWMADFDEAVKRGMGFRVDLTRDLASGGFDRLVVVGLKLSDDPEIGQASLETLLTHHYFSRTGFAFLSQGAATNNTEEGNSAYSRVDDADASYDCVFKGAAQFTETDLPLEKRDGQCFAEALGLDTEWLKQVPRAGGVDQREARAMNTALWPATLGYFMDTLLQPVFDDDQLYYTRAFFTHFVSGRGAVPAIRIGRQPYGILPTTAFNRIGWIADRQQDHLSTSVWLARETRLTPFGHWMVTFKSVLDRLRPIWNNLAAGTPHVDAKNPNPHQTLLDIIGLHPASVEFHQRYANTKEQEHNIAQIWQLAIPWTTLPANEQHNAAFDVLVQLGYTGSTVPQIFDLFWKVTTNQLDGPAIQVGPLSETDPLRPVTTNNHNYIEWLCEFAKVSFDTVRVQDGFQAGAWPNALLYVLLKHALELGYHDAGVRVLDEAGLLDDGLRQALKSEPHFFHVQDAPATPATAAGSVAAKSRYELLYSPDVRVTGDSTTLLVDHLTSRLGELFGTRYLSEQIAALDTLNKTPTARLERLLAEHLDCCGYRLDAWMSGLLNFQLASLRQSRRVQDGDGSSIEYRKGIHLGAYGWLENVRPANNELTPVDLDDTLDEIFNQQQPAGQQSPLVSDTDNEGYIHAPSLNHAVTAAVLRNGYLANATPAQPEVLKVNLSSERVRMALSMVEGIRGGQSLAALLGYEFERGLHDRYAFAECDQFIFPLRLVFPLYTHVDALPDGVTIESIEARNVVNGLNLLRHVRRAADADKTYPFGYPTTKLPFADAAQRKAIDAEVDRLLNIYDALADLAVAEGVHQVVMGNYDRAAATLDAYGQATFPPIPDVVQTPRSGIALTHRVAVHFETGVPIVAGDSPRVRAEPAMNRWIAGVLPPLARIGCTVSYRDAATGTEKKTRVTAVDLGLQPLDLLYVLRPDNLDARSELADRIADVVLSNAALAVRPDRLGAMSFTEGATGDYSFFEIAPFLRSLQALLLHSRPLQATDAALPTEAKSESSASVIERARVDFLPAALSSEKTTRLLPLKTQLDAVFPAAADPDAATILLNIDDYLAAIVVACQSLARYGLPQTGFGIFHERKAAVFASVLRASAAVAERWQDRLNQYDALLLTLPGLATDDEKRALLLTAERLVSVTPTDPTGKTVAQVQLLVDAKKAAFSTRRAAFVALQTTTVTKASAIVTAFKALLPLTTFETEVTDAAEIEKDLVVLAQDIAARTVQLIAAVDARADGVNKKLVDHDAVAAADARVRLLTEAGRLVLGDEFVFVPTFPLPTAQAAEWTNAYDNREPLLRHQKSALGNAFPVDDWMYGLARVRDKLHHVENLTFLADAFQTDGPELRAVQFPYAADAYWMAVEYPPEAKGRLERELLLYTAHYSVGFDGTARQCGLLLDEWTEVIPADTETTGLTFHFDKPNAEPPQVLLLALPPQLSGAWSWDDLVATLHETLDMARLRAVGPREVDQTALSVFLPAAILATTWQPITIAADLSIVNHYVSKMS
jgi:hypothetical protein